MRLRLRFVLFLTVALCPLACFSQIPYPNPIRHVVIVIQENRTVDNLFGSNSSSNQYYLPGLVFSTVGQAYERANGKKTVFDVQAIPVPLASLPGSGDSIDADDYDPVHAHEPAWLSACDAPKVTDPSTECAMDGFNYVQVVCASGVTGCPGPEYPTYAYVQYSDVAPYFQIAAQYGYANYMFQTNQGPSFPAHQFLFSGTSQPGVGSNPTWFVAENMVGNGPNGCIADKANTVALLDPVNLYEPGIYPCFTHPTMADLFAAQSPPITWRYYTTGQGNLWTAPDAMSTMCTNVDGVCTGPYWTSGATTGYIDPQPSDILKDVGDCKLQQVSWVIPSALESDHATLTDGSGPSWVASIVNKIGASSCTDSVNGKSLKYWDDTAILITWDDWGGWFDNVVPPPLPSNAPSIASSYVYGFRVPLLVVSAYTPAGTVSNTMGLDFGAILKFTEQVLGIDGVISNDPTNEYADYYATDDLSEFFQFDLVPLPFEPINAPLKEDVFLDPNRPHDGPDND
jgi:phospholipase C